MSNEERIQELRGKRDELTARLQEIAEGLEDVGADVPALSALITEREATKIRIEHLTGQIEEVNQAIRREERERTQAEIRELEGTYFEKVQVVAATARELRSQIAEAEDARRRIVAKGKQLDTSIPQFLAEAVNRSEGFWREHPPVAEDKPKRSFEEQSRINALSMAESTLARTMGLFRNAKQKRHQDKALEFKEQVERWRAEVKRLGGDPDQVAPSEELQTLVEGRRTVQRVSPDPEMNKKRGWANLASLLSPSKP